MPYSSNRPPANFNPCIIDEDFAKESIYYFYPTKSGTNDQWQDLFVILTSTQTAVGLHQ
jgi:hypothetical protein